SALRRKLVPERVRVGRCRQATRPSLTGSPPVTKTIGKVEVAALAANAERVLQTIRAACLRTKSATRAGNRWGWSSAERYSIATFWPSIKPASFKPFRKAATRYVASASEV